MTKNRLTALKAEIGIANPESEMINVIQNKMYNNIKQILQCVEDVIVEVKHTEQFMHSDHKKVDLTLRERLLSCLR